MLTEYASGWNTKIEEENLFLFLFNDLIFRDIVEFLTHPHFVTQNKTTRTQGLNKKKLMYMWVSTQKNTTSVQTAIINFTSSDTQTCREYVRKPTYIRHNSEMLTQTTCWFCCDPALSVTSEGVEGKREGGCWSAHSPPPTPWNTHTDTHKQTITRQRHRQKALIAIWGNKCSVCRWTVSESEPWRWQTPQKKNKNVIFVQIKTTHGYFFCQIGSWVRSSI